MVQQTKNVNPEGGAISACENDQACEPVSCEICLKEIPTSVAASIEGPDYVHHFCGLECLGVWRSRTGQMEK